MNWVLIRLRARDPDRLRGLLADRDMIRRASGCRTARLFRDTAEPGHAILLLAWDDPELAREYCESDAVRIALAEVGAEPSEVRYLEEVEAL
jgi:quinol monooxygenase YgiN